MTARIEVHVRAELRARTDCSVRAVSVAGIEIKARAETDVRIAEACASCTCGEDRNTMREPHHVHGLKWQCEPNKWRGPSDRREPMERHGAYEAREPSEEQGVCSKCEPRECED